MKESLAQLVAQAAIPVLGRNLAREYLQARILSVLQRAGAMAIKSTQGLPAQEPDRTIGRLHG
jgi:hypothetical protein